MYQISLIIALAYFIPVQSQEVDILLTKKSRFREAKRLVQGHTASQWQKGLNPGLPDVTARVLSSIPRWEEETKEEKRVEMEIDKCTRNSTQACK